MAADRADKAIAAEIEARKSADALIMAEQGRWSTAIIRPLLALPVVIFMWKVIVWDKVLGLGSTDALLGDVATWSGAIVTTYVGGRLLEKSLGPSGGAHQETHMSPARPSSIERIVIL